MNSRERFMTALRGGISDRVPLFEFHWNIPFIKSVLGQQASPYHNAAEAVAMSRATGIDMVWFPPYGFTAHTSARLHGESFQDEWGTWWGSNQDSWPGAWPKTQVVQSRQDWQRLRIPDPDLPERMEQPRRAVEMAQGELAVIGGVRGPFSAVWMLAGLVNISMWLYDDPEFLDELLREMGRWNTQLALHLIETGVDAVIIHDDYGTNVSTFISPDDWKRLVLPHLAQEIEAVTSRGTPVILHSDGNLNTILDEIVQLKIAALHPLQRTAKMDLAAIKTRYGDRLCLIGNLNTTTTLSQGTPAEVEYEVLECLRDAAPDGGYILAPDHSYHSAISFENTWQALNTCKKYGTYPLDMDAIQGRLGELEKNDLNKQKDSI